MFGLILLLEFGAEFVARAQTSPEVRLRYLVEKFFDAYLKEDLEGTLSLWSKDSPDLAATTQRLRRAFAANDKIELNSLTIQDVKVEGNKAAMRLVGNTSTTV